MKVAFEKGVIGNSQNQASIAILPKKDGGVLTVVTYDGVRMSLDMTMAEATNFGVGHVQAAAVAGHASAQAAAVAAAAQKAPANGAPPPSILE